MTSVGSRQLSSHLSAVIEGERTFVSHSGWGAVLGLALVSTVVAVLALLEGMSRVGPVSASLLSTVEPLVAVLLVMLALEWVDLLPLNYTIYSAPDPVSALFQILPGVNGVVLMTSLLLLLLAGWRLMRSYQLYLRFPHAIATVLASQIIVWLALVTLGAPVLEFLQDLLL